MAPQRSYKPNLERGVAGMPYSSHTSADVITALNDNPRAAQVVTFTITGADTDLEIDGVLFAPEGADNDARAEDLVELVNNDPLVSGAVLAEATDNVVTVTARVGGVGFAFAAPGGDVAASETQANATADPIPFGRAVIEDGENGDADGELLCKLIDDDDADAILGIALYTASFEKARPEFLGDRPASEYPGGSAVNILRKGRVYVPTEVDVAVGDDVYVRYAADGALDDIGGFAESSGTGLVQVENARWLRGTRRGLAVLQVDFV